jgi:hypothetical protein
MPAIFLFEIPGINKTIEFLNFTLNKQVVGPANVKNKLQYIFDCFMHLILVHRFLYNYPYSFYRLG